MLIFKSLRTKFQKYVMTNSHWGNAWPYDQLTKKLIEDEALTEFAVQVVATELYKNVLDKTFGAGAGSVFKIDPSVLVLKDEYKKKLKTTDLQRAHYGAPLAF